MKNTIASWITLSSGIFWIGQDGSWEERGLISFNPSAVVAIQDIDERLFPGKKSLGCVIYLQSGKSFTTNTPREEVLAIIRSGA